MFLVRLLILPALVTLLTLAGAARPAAAQVADCPCWPGGPPLVAPLVVQQSSTSQLNTFAFLPPATFIQVTDGWCRQNGVFRRVTPEEALLCAQQVQCLSSATELRPEELCNGIDDNCDGFVDEGFPLGQFCEDGLGDCRQTGGLICDPDDATGTICGATALDPIEPGAELSCTGGGDEDCDGQIDCADLDCEWDGNLADLTCKDPVCPDGIVDPGEQCDSSACCKADCTLEAVGTVCGIDEVCQAQLCSATGECLLETLDGTCDVPPAGPDDACDVTDDVCQAGVCIDTDPVAMAEVPCNGLDDDCDGATPDTPAGSCSAAAAGECANGTLACGPGGVICQPGTPAQEACNGLDDDCNGAADVAGPGSESDADGDAWSVCEGDCNDGDASIFPGRSDPCDGIDNDCDGAADNDSIASMCPLPANVAATACQGGAGCAIAQCSAGFLDSDGSYGTGCEAPACTPTPEVCNNGVDDDCDGRIDCADPSCSGNPACPTPGCVCTGTNNCANAGSPGTVCCQRRNNPQDFSCIGVSLSVGGCFDGNPPGEANFEEQCIP